MLKLWNVSELRDLCATIEDRQYAGRVQKIHVTCVFDNLDPVDNVITGGEFGTSHYN